MEQNKTKLKIVTPHGIFYNDLIALVSVKTTEGNIGLQHGKSPFVSSISISKLTIFKSWNKKDKKVCAIGGGLIYANPEEIKIITDEIEFKENIEVSHAEKELKLAQKKLKDKLSREEHEHQTLILKRAINRIHVKKD